MISITIRTSSGRPIERIARDIEVAATKGGRKGITNIARMITRQLKVEVPIWRSNLRDSIKSRSLSENEVGVFMNFYGMMVEKGHRIGAIPPTFMQWIRDKWNPSITDSPEGFARALILKGRTEANPFITRALMKVQDKYGQEALMAIRQSLKETGFKEG